VTRRPVAESRGVFRAGETAWPVGCHHQLRMRQWRRTHLVGALRDKAEAAGMEVVWVDERGTSSTCRSVGPGLPSRPGGTSPVLAVATRGTAT
jgi:hypothetical protein